jgi:hypothetical protein
MKYRVHRIDVNKDNMQEKVDRIRISCWDKILCYC